MVTRGMKFLAPTKSFLSKKRVDKLVSTGMRDFATIQVSIDGITADIDEMMNSSNYAERALSTIENLVNNGFFVRTNTVCTPVNVRGIPQLVRTLFEKGVKRAGVTNYSRSFFRHNDALFLDLEQINRAQKEVADLKEELNWGELHCNMGIRDFSVIANEEKKSGWKKRAHCSGGKSAMTITADGQVILCEQVPQTEPFIVGSVKERSLLEIWNSPVINSFVYPSRDLFGSAVCRDCPEFDECHQVYGRCFRDALFTYGSMYAPSPNCPYAPKGLRMS
jgi:radical SAM protein with 4Fe4S-binding SPASM domain